MYQIISVVVAALGVVLFFAPEYILQNSSNKTIEMVRDYNRIVGVGLVGAAYYLYMYRSKTTSSQVSAISDASIESVTPPSYEEATSED
jgi:drug/metabolite transporter (DMT)-like permease